MLLCILLIFSFQIILESNGYIIGGVEVTSRGVGSANEVGSLSQSQ